MTARRIGEILGTNALLGGARALLLNLAGLRPLAERASALLAGTGELSRQVEDLRCANARLTEELAARNGTLAALQKELDAAKARGRARAEAIELLRKEIGGNLDAEQARRLSVLDETLIEHSADTAPRLPAILLNTLPKSGSIYIMRTLALSLSVEFFDKSVAFGYFPKYFMVLDALERLRAGNVVRQEHFDATQLNIGLCSRYVDRVVLHVRDPRQAMHSWAHHVNRLAALAPDGVNYTIHQLPPPGFSDQPFQQQLDWHIETHLVSLVSWLKEWLAYEKRSGPIALLWTSYEELVADERALFQRILDFHEIPRARFDFRPAAKTIDNNFRSGRPDEWKETFTDRQKARCEAIIGSDLLRHFGWEMLSRSGRVEDFRWINQAGVGSCRLDGPDIRLSTGKWYWEMTFENVGAGGDGLAATVSIGVCAPGYPRTVGLGAQPGAWGWRADGHRLVEGQVSAGFGTPMRRTSDVVMVALDADARRLWVGLNGTWFDGGNPATGARPSFEGFEVPVGPAVSSKHEGLGSAVVNVLFSPGAWKHPPPAGYLSCVTIDRHDSGSDSPGA